MRLAWWLTLTLFIVLAMAVDSHARRRRRQRRQRHQHLHDLMYDDHDHKECEHEVDRRRRRRTSLEHNRRTKLEPRISRPTTGHTKLPNNNLDPKALFNCVPEQGCTMGLVCRRRVCTPCHSHHECPHRTWCKPSPPIIKLAIAVGIGIGPNAGAEAEAKVAPKFRGDSRSPLSTLSRLLSFLDKNFPEGSKRCQTKKSEKLTESEHDRNEEAVQPTLDHHKGDVEESHYHEDEEEEYHDDHLLY